MAFRNIPPNGFPALPDLEDLEAVVKSVGTLTTTISGLAEDVGDLEEQKANQITIALPFNPETTYEVGDLVYYNGLSYRCTNEHTGEWDADDFAGTTIANELSTLKSGLTSVSGKIPIRGSFSLLCNVGTNVFTRATMTLVGGSIPQSPFNSCIMMIVNHASNNATNDTIQVDGANTIIINAQVEQIISVMWLDASNIPIADT